MSKVRGKCSAQLLIALTAGLLASCAAAGPNILVLIADDLGTEALEIYGIGSPTATTPNIDSLANDGLRFERFWSQPSCTPSRSAILTGRYAYRTGVDRALWYQWSELNAPAPDLSASTQNELFYTRGRQVEAQEHITKPPPEGLPAGPASNELMLPAALLRSGASLVSGSVGKWHLADLKNGGLDHPSEVGFDYFSGILFGSPGSYFVWRHLENGKLTAEQGYLDTRSVEDALSWIDGREEPWFVTINFSNPHTPIHKPPADLLHSQLRLIDPNPTGNDNRLYFLAQVEAMDTLIGRVLSSLSEEDRRNTYIIFLGDNGSDSVANPPEPRVSNRLKATLYEGGINVPVIVAGPGISHGKVVDHPAHVVDLFSTIIELAGGKVDRLTASGLELDSISLAPYLFEDNPLPQRQWVLAEHPRGRALRDHRYKLLVMDGAEEFYDLDADPNELHPLQQASLNDKANSSYHFLKARLAELPPMQ